MRTSFIALVAAGVLASGVARAADTPENFDPSASPAVMAGKFVEVENPEYLKGLKRVVIPSFMVEFVTEAKASVALSGIQLAMGGNSSALIRIKGAQPEQFQEVTDRLYEQTVAELRQAGIEVVDKAVLQASPTFKAMAEKGEKAPRPEEAKGGKGVFHTAEGLPLYFMNEQAFITKLFSKPKEDLYLTFGTQFASNFSTAQMPALEEQLARELDATVLKVRITFLGGTAKRESNIWIGGSAKAEGAASFAPVATRYAFITGKGDKARISLKDTVNTGQIGEMVNVTSSASKAVDVARNTLTVASRFGAAFGMRGIDLGYGNDVEYEWQVEPGSFEKVIVDFHPAIARMFLSSVLANGGAPDQQAAK